MQHSDDWKREWEEEQQLTPEEQRLADIEAEENERIMEDMLACIRQIEDEEYREEQREWESYQDKIEEQQYGYVDYEDEWDFGEL